MPTASTDDEHPAWDFSAVYDLINTLSPRVSTPQGEHRPDRSKHLSQSSERKVAFDGLGNFGKLWDYLGIDAEPSSPAVPTFEASTAVKFLSNDSYVSDGATYYPPSSKSVRWKDQSDYSDHAETQDEKATVKKLTKTQRKRLNRQTRKRMQPNLLVGSDDEVGPKTDPKSASLISEQTLPQTPERRQLTFSATETPASISDVSLRLPQIVPLPKHRNGVLSSEPPKSTSNLTLTPTHIKPSDSTNLAVKAVQESLRKQWPVAKPFQERLASLPPATNNSPPKSYYAHRRHLQLLPLEGTTATDRNWTLLNKLLRDFPEDRSHLLSPLQLSINRPQPHGIHVFVDASNILIGFHEHLKRVRNVPAGAHVGRVDLAFHALALLLERRRPIAKRVLAGSTPEIPAFEEARQVGYETNILDKVLKAKELTARQKKFAAQARHGHGHSGASAGSDTDAGPYGHYEAQPKWVEQAVDEILHLKILESIVDVAASTRPTTASTAPTMVLASGDAAEAEYSDGFLKQVERALHSGWNVEVVAWGESISQGYRRLQKMGRKRFKVIELDDYVEELFGTSDLL